MLLRATDLAIELRVTSFVDRVLMRYYPTKRAKEIVNRARRRLIERLLKEDSTVAELAAFLAGGAPEYRALIQAKKGLEGR